MKVSKVKVSNIVFFWRAKNKVLNFWMQPHLLLEITACTQLHVSIGMNKQSKWLELAYQSFQHITFNIMFVTWLYISFFTPDQTVIRLEINKYAKFSREQTKPRSIAKETFRLHLTKNDNLKLIDQLTCPQSFHSQGYSFILVVVTRFMWKKSTWFTQFFTQWVPPWSWMVQWFTWYSNLVGDYG